MSDAAPVAEARRIKSLDVMRGFAVLGILAVNAAYFSAPWQAAMNPASPPLAVTEGTLWAWLVMHVFFEFKCITLFSMLFGASLYMVGGERADPERGAVLRRRLLWLLAFGLIHGLLIWYGDILIGYALVGMVAWFFRDFSARSLVRWGIALVAVQLLILSAFAFYNHSLSAAIEARTATPAMLEIWGEMTKDVAIPSAALLKEELALYLGPWTGIVGHQLTEEAFMPVFFTFLFGWETLAYMLFGMAGLKSGFLTGTWDASDYRRLARRCLMIGIPAYVALLALINLDRFSVPGLFTYAFAATVPFRPLMVAGYAAIAILATQRGGWLAGRIAAAGRAAFTNYLGTSLVMTFVFYGWGLGYWGRAGQALQLALSFAIFALQAAVSELWLRRYSWGPLEYLWRLATYGRQPAAAVPQQAAAR